MQLTGNGRDVEFLESLVAEVEKNVDGKFDFLHCLTIRGYAFIWTSLVRQLLTLILCRHEDSGGRRG
jgi:hypothetical protein